MSIPVALDELDRALSDVGHGYLLTTRAGRVRVVSALPRLVDGRLVVSGPGRGSLANVVDEPAVTLLWPPLVEGGMSLLVDGTATTEGDDVVVVPQGAVLHRSVAP